MACHRASAGSVSNPGDFRRGVNAHAIADRDQADEAAVIDHRHAQGAVPQAPRKRDRDAFNGMDRDIQP
jgi:hypothetical protein